MKQFNLSLTSLLLLGATALPMSMSAQVSNDNEDGVVKMNAKHSRYDYVPGQILVKFNDKQTVKVNRASAVVSTNVSQLTGVLQKYGVGEMEQLLPDAKPTFKGRRAKAFNGDNIEEHDLSQLYEVKLPADRIQETMQLVEELQKLDEVEYAEPNYRLYALEGNLIDGNSGGNPYVTSQWYLEDYGVTTLWNADIKNDERPVIAILDTGVDITHPDLVDNIWTNAGEYQGENGYDNDNNGFKNDLHGWDFINNSPNIRDFNKHGTHVAGIAAASNNDIGIIGANPKAYIMPVTVMQSDGTGDVATIVKGINYAVANGATILNMSLGTYANSRALRQALENAYQKAVLVAAAGNDGMQILPVCNPLLPYGPMFPAAYSFVLGVMATNQEGDLASFSNYDCDGPNFSSTSTVQDPDGFNYELKAPGTAMYSTLPGGKYGNLNGTSMAAPLVAGAISALTMVKDYRKDDGIRQEILWGDLLHTDNIAQAYAVTNRPAELDLKKIMYRERKELADETEEDYSGDGRIDAGETVSLYPVIRTTFGAASNIKMKLEMGDEYEDPDLVTILTPDWVDFGLPLSAYAKGVSLNPLQLKVADNVANGRHIKMKFSAICDESNVTYVGTFTMVVDNIIKIGGAITSDITLTSDKEYAVSKTLLVTNNATLTIQPGTTLRFMDYAGISVDQGAKLIAKGTPGNMITFTTNVGATGYLSGIKQRQDETIEYAVFDNFVYYDDNFLGLYSGIFKNCIIKNNGDEVPAAGYTFMFYGSNLINSVCDGNYFHGGMSASNWENTNITNNYGSTMMDCSNYSFSRNRDVHNCNIINLSFGDEQVYWGGKETGYYKNDYPNYYGSSKEEIVRRGIWDVERGDGFTFWDPASMRTTPVYEAHGIVWKVCVNGKDAQDEYEDLAPLGVGKHKFEVYFNRPMNKEVAPQITFGVRDPWTQNAVAEDGSWNEEGTIYTAYKTITGKTKSDGINRIYVRGAEDNEYFEIPDEKTRFNFMINAAGSMATGFAGEGKMGRVELTWNNDENDFDDAMGFNIYRFNPDVKRTIPAHYDENWNWIEETQVVDTICINKEIVDIETTEYTDYDVVPRQTYYYMYKVLSTDLKEYDVSNIVAVTPLTSSKGDANGDGNVNVMDVTSAVDYIVGQDPKPFVFEAADMNTDATINVLDVVGIVNKILNSSTASTSAFEDAQEAIYTIEGGVLYIETPVALAGLQIQLSVEDDQDLTTSSSLKGFEQATTWLSENDYRLLVYNFGSRHLKPGKHAIMNMGNAEITSLCLSNRQGGLVRAIAGQGTTAIKDAMGSKVQNVKGIYNLNGQKLTESSKLQRGVYIINGQKVIK